jgi:hypothetical protein
MTRGRRGSRGGGRGGAKVAGRRRKSLLFLKPPCHRALTDHI